MEFIKSLLGGAVGAAFVTGIFSVVLWRMKRKAEQEDKVDDKYDHLRKEFENIKEGMQLFFYDRIKYLANSYISNGEIEEVDRQMLTKMHELYHTYGGNGYLKSRMDKVLDLPGKDIKHD